MTSLAEEISSTARGNVFNGRKSRRIPISHPEDLDVANALQVLSGSEPTAKPDAVEGGGEQEPAHEIVATDSETIKGAPADGKFRRDVVSMFEMVDAAVADAMATRNENSDLKSEIARLGDALTQERNRIFMLEAEKRNVEGRLQAEREETVRLRTHMEVQAHSMLNALKGRQT